MKKLIMLLAALTAAPTFADTKLASAFPLEVKSSVQRDFVTYLTFAAPPGMSFCVSYATARGAFISSLKMGGRPSPNELSECLVADKNGVASHSVRAGQSGLLLVNLITVDYRVGVTAIQLHP